MTLWSDFLRRLMLGASLSGAAAAGGADDAAATPRPAEIGEHQPEPSGTHQGTPPVQHSRPAG